jgi:hypothetical protein
MGQDNRQHYIRCAIGATGSPSAVGTWHGLGWYQNPSSTTDGGASIWDFTEALTDAGINNGTGRAPLQPINFFTYDNTDSVNFREGYNKGIRVINMSLPAFFRCMLIPGRCPHDLNIFTRNCRSTADL